MSNINDGKFRKKVPFAAVSIVPLEDENLSMKAKGLYAIIQRYITIPEFTLYKSALLNKSTDGLRAFNSAWDELKKHGYLKQYRIREIKGWRYEYDLLDVPDLDTPATIDIGLNGEISNNTTVAEVKTNEAKTTEDELSEQNPRLETSDEEGTKEQKNQNKKFTKPPDTETSYRKTVEEVDKRIEYDYFTQNSDSRELNFATSIRDIIVEVSLSNEKKIKIGGELKNGDEVRATFNRFNSKHLTQLSERLDDYPESIDNPKSFLLTCIYNAVKTGGLRDKLFDNY